SAFGYTHGTTAYERIDALTARDGVDAGRTITHELLRWVTTSLSAPVSYVTRGESCAAALEFYRDKTRTRIGALTGLMYTQALTAIQSIDWHALATGCRPVVGHGDL